MREYSLLPHFPQTENREQTENQTRKTHIHPHNNAG